MTDTTTPDTRAELAVRGDDDLYRWVAAGELLDADECSALGLDPTSRGL